MKKIVTFICVLVLLVSSVVGCSLFSKQGADYATSAVNLKLESTLIKTQYQKIYTVVQSNKAKFTDTEWQQLNEVNFAFTEASTRIEGVLKNPENVVTPVELKQMYDLAYIGYSEAKGILVNHKSEFTEYQWLELQNFDKQAVEYDKQVRSILDNPSTDDINKTLGIIIVLGSMAYKYLLPVLMSLI